MLFGRFSGFGFIGRTLAGAEVYVMPGPFERADRLKEALLTLAARWRADS
ncbi:MAG: hypothetical protein F2663_04470 [Actinobacteria bacterium]|uniref:Unannotated protein n=1 Tax=freshwater metagenome TaxID=449393 RepID=A0A6J6P6F9_9ZZZZ|nr:hypothetical protein [Actinomycetota bacterium]